MKKANLLNELSGSQWLYWTDTLYITGFPPDATFGLRKQHGAMKPPELMAEIISFFTKKDEVVLDPFAGVGGTLIGAALTERRGIGFELNHRWVEIYRQIQREYVVVNGVLQSQAHNRGQPISSPLYEGDCLALMAGLEADSIDAIITDPPYGCRHRVTGFEKETNFNMFNPDTPLDFANAPDFDSFLQLMERFGREAWRVLKNKRYLIMIIGDRYVQGEFMPLGFLVAEKLRQVGFKLKGIRIWSNKATQRPLKPYAIYTSFVPNITHQNILILRKEA
jgi:DNA modification methylase